MAAAASPLLASLLPTLLGLGAATIGGVGTGLMQGKKGLFGQPGRLQQVGRFTPEQQAIFGDILGGAKGQLGGAFDFLGGILNQSPEAMAKFEAPALRQFREQIIPDIAQRFGETGALSSSGFQQTLGQAGERLAENLAAQRGQLGFQGLGALGNLLGMGLTPQFDYFQIPGSRGFFGDVTSMLLGGK